MEEILASIRRIISEDEPPASDEGAEVASEVSPEPAPAAAHVEPEDVLELTERVPEPVAPAVESVGDLDLVPIVEHEPEPLPEPVALAHAPIEGSLLSEPAAEAASSAFGQLSSSLLMPKDGRTLEDVVREQLRPLLKSWLDENLPGIVQAAVNEEVERLSRRRV